MDAARIASRPMSMGQVMKSGVHQSSPSSGISREIGTSATQVESSSVRPKLAVVITCFNYAQYVGLAIQSVQSQGRSDCEIVVVDDGSTDGSWDVIESFGVKAFRIENGGQRGACYFGFKQTSAPFILFLDADDELLPGSLDVIVNKLDSGVAKLQFPLRRVNRDGEAISGPIPALKDDRGRALARRVLKTGVYPSPPTSGNVFRRDVCELLESAEYDNAVDGVILFAAPFMGDIVSVGQELGLYRVHDRNKSGVGNLLNPLSFHGDLQRFLDRMQHLRQVLDEHGLAVDLVAAERTYYFLERSLYLAIASDETISASDLLRLVMTLWSDEHPIRAKLSLTTFFVLVGLVSKERARRLLAYRLGAGIRSTPGLVRALL